MKTSNITLLAAIASSLAAHAFTALIPSVVQDSQGIRDRPTVAAPALAFNYVSVTNPVQMRAPTSTEEQYRQPQTNVSQGTESGVRTVETHRTPAGEGPMRQDGEAFFPASQLSRPAQPAVPVTLESADLGLTSPSGRSVLKVWIDSRGNVVETIIESGDMPGQFARLAAEAFRKAPFIPGERNGRPVGAIMRIEVRYEDLVDLPV